MQLSEPISTVNLQPPDKKPLPATYALPNTRFTSAAYITPAIANSSTSHSRKLSNLAKIYTNIGKYSDRNDRFISKLAIFYDICLNADVILEAKAKALLAMHKNLALNFYNSNMSMSVVAMNFDHVYNSIKNDFEEDKYNQSVFLKWNRLKIKSVISKNKSKLIEKCLDKLIDKLWHLQYSLDPQFYTNRFIHNKLFNGY